MSDSMIGALEAAHAAEEKCHAANANVASVAQKYLDGRATHDELADASADAVHAAAARDTAWTVYRRLVGSSQ